MKALFNRNLGVAEQHLRAALEHPGELDPHQRQLAHLALAIARGNRERAQQIAREMHQANPDDPDLRRVREAFPIKPREGEGGRRRGKPLDQSSILIPAVLKLLHEAFVRPGMILRSKSQRARKNRSFGVAKAVQR